MAETQASSSATERTTLVAKEVDKHEVSMLSKCFAEFLGTFMLVFTVGCNVLAKNAMWGGVSIASVLMVMIYAKGGISGANFNPAVTLAIALSKVMGGPGHDFMVFLWYFLAQASAGTLAGWCYSALYQDTFDLAPNPEFGWLSAVMCEVLYTFMLCFVVLNTAVAANVTKKGDQYYGMAIGFVIIAGAYGAGAISGGCFNPAVAWGIDTSSHAKGFGWCLVYIAFELIGAVLAALLFRVVRPEEFGGERTMVSRLTSEFLGTFMLVLTVGLTVYAKTEAAVYAIAASLMSMIYALGDISGAHFNPAVTLAIFISGRAELTAADTALYWVAQIFGGIAAGFAYSLLRLSFSFGLPEVTMEHGLVAAAAAEIVFTSLLCYTVLSVAVSKKTYAPHMFGLAIASCVTVGGYAIGGLSGGSLNPAVSFGIETAHTLGGGTFYRGALWAVFEILGALWSVLIFKITHLVEEDHDHPVLGYLKEAP